MAEETPRDSLEKEVKIISAPSVKPIKFVDHQGAEHLFHIKPLSFVDLEDNENKIIKLVSSFKSSAEKLSVFGKIIEQIGKATIQAVQRDQTNSCSVRQGDGGTASQEVNAAVSGGDFIIEAGDIIALISSGSQIAQFIIELGSDLKWDIIKQSSIWTVASVIMEIIAYNYGERLMDFLAGMPVAQKRLQKLMEVAGTDQKQS